MRAAAISVDRLGTRAIAAALRSSSTSTIALPPGCGRMRSILSTRAHTRAAYPMRRAVPAGSAACEGVALGVEDVALVGGELEADGLVLGGRRLLDLGEDAAAVLLLA